MDITPLSRIGTDRQDIMELDPDLLRRHQAWRAKGSWSGGFSVAAWLRFPEGLVEMARLMLSFRDQERRKTYLIDRCLPNRQTLILLNGRANLEVRGEVADMSLCLTGLSEHAVWMLDECRIEPSRAAVLEDGLSNSKPVGIGKCVGGMSGSKRS